MKWLKENKEKIIEKVQLIIFTALIISALLLVFVIWFLLPDEYIHLPVILIIIILITMWLNEKWSLRK